MKRLYTSDINTMLQSTTMSNAAVCLALPVTALIWGMDVHASAGTAIWGTSAIGGASRRQNFSAIWGTCGRAAPPQHAGMASNSLGESKPN